MAKRHAPVLVVEMFIAAVYPEIPNLALSFDEETVLTRATQLLLREGLLERLIEEIETWQGGELKYVSVGTGNWDTEARVTTTGREKLKKAIDDWKNEHPR